MLNFPAKMMVYLLALIIGILPMQSVMASIGKCETANIDQQHRLPHAMESVDHSGHAASECAICVEHPDCGKSGVCSSGHCGVNVGMLSAVAGIHVDFSSLCFTHYLPQKLTNPTSLHYRPPWG